MTQTLLYKGYQGTVDADVESNVLHGKILFINDLVTYEADTLPELKKEFETSVDDYLETCKEIGKEPDKPFSGTFNIRIGKEIHQQIARIAASDSISINQFILDSLNETLKKRMNENRFIGESAQYFTTLMQQINPVSITKNNNTSFKQIIDITRRVDINEH